MRVTLRRRPLPPENMKVISRGADCHPDAKRGRANPQAWRADELAALERLAAEGKAASEIGAALKRSRNSVIGMILRLREKGNSQIRLKGKARRPGHSPDKVAAARAALAAGLKTHAGIAAELGVAPSWVSKIARAQGLARRQSRRQVSDAGIKGRMRVRLARLEEQGIPPVTGYRAESFLQGFQGQVGRVALADLEFSHCRFPIDMPPGEHGVSEVRYCGLPKEEGGSYCAHHAARCFTGPVGNTPRKGDGFPLRRVNHGGWA